MSSAELNQCVFDITSWFTRNKLNRKLEPANSADFQRVEKALDMQLPHPVKVLLSEANGGLYFMDKELLGTEKMLDVLGVVERSKLWKTSLIPLFGDESALLVLDSRSEQVLEWDCDDGLGDVVSQNVVALLEVYRNDLLSGHYEYLEDVGVIEKVGKTMHKSHK